MSAVTKRIASIDILRGLVMIIMALDHTRDFFTNFQYEPTDLEHASTAMFFTRWITHFCAPVFVFLSGTSAFLSLTRGGTRKEASIKLFTRGLWLIILELTVVRLGWTFNLDYSIVVMQVIWAIGWSMIFLSVLIFLPLRLIAIIALVMIFSHNLLDGMHAAQYGGVWWNMVHEFGFIPFGEGRMLAVIYPLVPWIGVMAAGYCFGSIMQQEEKKRARHLYAIGFSAIILFIVLRWFNNYGDPAPWQAQATWGRTFLSFIKCTKYPPSLLYLLMTLGPAIAAMPLLEKLNARLAGFFTVYGRVPLFYYVLHIYLIHSMAVIVGLINGFPVSHFTENVFNLSTNGWGFDLAIVYLFWLAAVILLYLPSRWFMKVKMTSKRWWLSYL